MEAAEATSTTSSPLPAAIEPARQSRHPREAVSQLPWPDPAPAECTKWERFACFETLWEGPILGGLLESEGMPVVVEIGWPGLDARSYSIVYVPLELVHRARWILSWPAPSEAELILLATGELPGEE